MALRIRGKHGYYHAYYDVWEKTEDGLRRKRVTVNLGTTDRDVAKSLDVKLMKHAREKSVESRASAKIEAILTGGTVKIQQAVKRRLKLKDALERASRYHDFGITAKNYWKRFEKGIGVSYMNEVTPELAFAYLDKLNLSGKSYNNMKCSLNAIFKTLLLDSGMTASPFDRLPVRKSSTLVQRPFTRSEYYRMRALALYPWKQAIQIAWWTGMRKKDVFTLRWSEITDGWIVKTPAKTARYRKAVEIPIHRGLQAVLDALPHTSEFVLPSSQNEIDRGFRKLLRWCDISEDESGSINFNCFRDSFITRCDEAQIPRHTTRGIAGQKSDRITDLYSRDRKSATLILTRLR